MSHIPAIRQRLRYVSFAREVRENRTPLTRRCQKEIKKLRFFKPRPFDPHSSVPERRCFSYSDTSTRTPLGSTRNREIRAKTAIGGSDLHTPNTPTRNRTNRANRRTSGIRPVSDHFLIFSHVYRHHETLTSLVRPLKATAQTKVHRTTCTEGSPASASHSIVGKLVANLS